MEQLHLSFYGIRYRPYVNIDGKEIKVKKHGKDSYISLQISPGKHRISFCEKRTLYKWYWWLMCLNILYPFLCFRGWSGKQVGYDGECASVCFDILCQKQILTDVKIKRREILWDQTPLNANYNILSIHSNMPLYLVSTTLDSSKVFRLKAIMAIPFILFTILYTFLWCLSLANYLFEPLDLFISCVIEIAILVYSAYKIYKIKKQKNFFECSKNSRVNISIKK